MWYSLVLIIIQIQGQNLNKAPRLREVWSMSSTLTVLRLGARCPTNFSVQIRLIRLLSGWEKDPKLHQSRRRAVLWSVINIRIMWKYFFIIVVNVAVINRTAQNKPHLYWDAQSDVDRWRAEEWKGRGRKQHSVNMRQNINIDCLTQLDLCLFIKCVWSSADQQT